VCCSHVQKIGQAAYKSVVCVNLSLVRLKLLKKHAADLSNIRSEIRRDYSKVPICCVCSNVNCRIEGMGCT
jgi:hypothetical protein